MPNGVSCAYFAAKNYLYGKRDKNLFRTGIAGAQTARTVDCVSQAAAKTSKLSCLTGKIALCARKLLYPLIIASGIYTTAKSNDKVKTGVSQASAIATMYGFEKGAEKLLKGTEQKLLNNPFFKENKKARICLYILKGIAYASASLLGYDTGNKAGQAIVDKIKGNNNSKYDNLLTIDDIEHTNNNEENKAKIFEDIEQLNITEDSKENTFENTESELQ